MEIGIIGTGHVGAATAYVLAVTGSATKIVLVNRTNSRAIAEATDISHALPIIGNCNVIAGDFDQLSNCDVIIITCGSTLKSAAVNDRLDLLSFNLQIYTQIISTVEQIAPNAVLLIVSNPVDVLANITSKISKFPARHVISSGTLLDTVRFQTVIGEYFKVPATAVDANIWGEHGDSQVAIWSNAKIFGEKIEGFAKSTSVNFNEKTKLMLEKQTRSSAAKIVAGKQATYYGIAGSIAKICRAMATNTPTLLNISTFHENFCGIENVFISSPTIVHGKSFNNSLNIDVSEKEFLTLKESAQIIKRNTQRAIELYKSLPSAI